MSNRGMVILHDPHEKRYEPLSLSNVARIDTTRPVFKIDVLELYYEGVEMVYIVEKDDAVITYKDEREGIEAQA